MKSSKKENKRNSVASHAEGYEHLVVDITQLLEAGRRQAARAINAILTATYWQIERCIVEFEQSGEKRAAYGEELLVKLSRDLTVKFGRGFGVDQLELMRLFYINYPPPYDFRDTVSEFRITDSEIINACPCLIKIRIGDSDFDV